MTSVFISYTRKNSDFVDFLDALLPSWGVDVFVDRNSLRSGPNITQFEREILRRDYFLLVATRVALSRYWVQGEYQFAYGIEKREKMIPLMLESISLNRNFALGTLEKVDFTGWSDNYNIHDATLKLARLMDIPLTPRECTTTTDAALARKVKRRGSSTYVRTWKKYISETNKTTESDQDQFLGSRPESGNNPDHSVGPSLYRTGEKAPSTGLYTWIMYSDGSKTPSPTANERLIRIGRGESCPPIPSTGKAAWWMRSGWYPRRQIMPQPQNPGETPSKPGEFVECGPRGGEIRRPRVVTIDKGDKLPPTQKPGRTWVRIGPRKQNEGTSMALIKTGEKTPRRGNFDWVRYTDGTTYPPPTAEERRIRLDVGERFPPIASASKAALWRWAGTR